MTETELVVLAAAFIAFALVSRRVEPLPVTMPMVFVTLGVLADATGIVDFTGQVGVLTALGEITLAVILFSDAARTNLVTLRRGSRLPIRLLLIGLPLTIALGTLLLWGIFPVSTTAEFALVAAILAPTDAALGSAVVENEKVPARIRQALNVESGLNDGLALPAVTMFIAIVLDEGTGGGFWLRFALRQIGLGAVVGLAIGCAAAWLLKRSQEAGWMDGAFAQIGILATAVLSFAAAHEVDANGFIAAFVAGMAVGGVLGRDTTTQLDEFSDETGRLLAAVTFFVFGNVFVIAAFEHLTWRIALAAALILTVARMLPVAVAVADLKMAWQTVVFLGWFGPRGLASMLFGLLLFDEGIERADEFFGVIAITITASVFLHGATAAWGAERYGNWFAAAHGESDGMREARPISAARPRWTRP